MPKKANIGDTIMTKSGVEFVVMSEEYDEKEDVQLVYYVSDEYFDKNPEQRFFSPESYGVPDCNFEVIKNKDTNVLK